MSQNHEPRRLSRTSFLIAAAFLMILAVAFLWSICFVTVLNNDLALIPLGADLILRGGLLYRDMHTVVLPGSYWLLALVFKLFGARWLVCEQVALLMFLAIGSLVIALSRQFLAGWLVFMPPAIFFAIGPPLCPFNYHQWDMLAFYLLFTMLLLRGIEKEGLRWHTFFLAGAAGGLSTLCLQNVAPAVIVGSAATAVLTGFQAGSRRHGLDSFAAMISGFSIVMAGTLLYLGLTGTLEPMVDCAFRFVSEQYRQVNQVSYGYANFLDLLMTTFPTPWGPLSGLSFELIKQAPLWVFIASAAYLLSVGTWQETVRSRPKVLILLVLGYGLWLAELHRPDLKRLLWGSQLLLILLFFLLERLSYRFPVTRLAVRAFCLLTVAGLVLDASWFRNFYAPVPHFVTTRRGTIVTRNDLSIVKAVQSRTEPYEKVLVYPYDTAINFFSMTTFPSIYPFLQYRYNTPAQMQQMIDDMEKNRVQYAVWNLQVNNASFQDFGFPSYEPVPADQCLMENYLLSKYEFVKAYGNYRLMRRKRDH